MPRDPSPELLDLFFETTEDYGVLLLDAAGTVRGWNPAAERLFGFTAREMEGTDGRRIFVEPDRRAGIPEMELRTAEERGRAEDERWHLRKDGTRFWASGVMISLRRDRTLLGFAKVIQDLTERRRLEDAARESQRLESLGVLAAGVAHDFNNLLTAVIGNLSLARRELNRRRDDSVVSLLREAECAGQRAAELVRQLLDYAGKGRRVVKAVDVCRVAADAISTVRASVSPGIELRTELAHDCPPVEADVGQLQQLLLNLVLNAAEAIGDAPGTITIRVRVRDVPDPELRASYSQFSLAARRYLEIVVADTGAGMAPETLRQIFDPFFSTKFLGRGLGLAAALGIVRSHGGGISVESAPGEGTTFRVLLPAEPAVDDTEVSTVSEVVVGNARGEGLVLVVDDEPGIRSLAQRSVEALGYTALLAENGEQALQVFGRVGPELVLVLLDLVMPVLDGASVAPRLLERRPDLPIIVMSGLADQNALGRLGQTRIAGFVPKPFNPEQLAQSIAVARRLTAE